MSTNPPATSSQTSSSETTIYALMVINVVGTHGCSVLEKLHPFTQDAESAAGGGGGGDGSGGGRRRPWRHCEN
jgi:hypothetical protein